MKHEKHESKIRKNLEIKPALIYFCFLVTFELKNCLNCFNLSYRLRYVP